uniref:BPTI/Kunitz inhibitor domain-containing protein n=1 Tax=Salarias fasciatus TaxID=181472 RepID=A0A672J461_SALFA
AIKATVTKTEMTPDMGEGTKFHYAVYYDPSTDQCSPFHYKGEKGNANRFEHERECIRNCSDNAENIYPMEDAKACTLKKMVGGCDGSFLRYYYDPIHDKCKKFLYSGCLGNGNRFFDSGSCNNTCVGIHGEHIFPLSATCLNVRLNLAQFPSE